MGRGITAALAVGPICSALCSPFSLVIGAPLVCYQEHSLADHGSPPVFHVLFEENCSSLPICVAIQGISHTTLFS